MENSAVKPWYQQFWFWFLVSIPFTSVVLSSIMVFKALDEPDTLVSANYYKDGLAINQDISLDRHAYESGMSANIRSNAESNQFTITLNSGSEISPDTLVVLLEHPTKKNSDSTLQLEKNGEDYQVSIAENIEGKRYITITTTEATWQLRGEVNFPSVSGHLITPTIH